MATEREIERLVVRLLGDARPYMDTLRRVEQQTSGALRNVGRMAGQLGRSLSLRITAPIAGIGFFATRAFSQFDNAMTESTSIMKVTEEQTARMRQQALELGSRGVKGPEELARSYFFLASAGKSAEQSMALLPPLTEFATAGAFDMATATDLLTDAQSALGLTSKNVAQDQKNLIRLSDALVRANTLSNATVQQFSESLTNTAGASLKAFNKDIEEGLALLGAYADQGVKGAVAGTSLSRVLLLLSKSTRDNAAEHAKLGFRVFDASGKMRNFADIVENLEDITAGMSDETKAATLEQLGFQARIQQAILPLLGTSESIRRYEKELRNAGGTTKAVAEKQLKSFSNQMKVLRNQLFAAGVSIGQQLSPYLLKLNELLKSGLAFWNRLHPSVKQFVVTVGLAAAAVGPLLILFGGLISSLGFIATGFGALIGTIGTVASVIGAVISPIGVLIAAIGTLAAVAIVKTGAAGKVVQWFGRQWSALVEFVKPAIDGIVAAIEAGDMNLAFEIAWAQIKLTFSEGTGFIRNIWNEMIVVLAESLVSFVEGIDRLIKRFLHIDTGLTEALIGDPDAVRQAIKEDTQAVSDNIKGELDSLIKKRDRAVQEAQNIQPTGTTPAQEALPDLGGVGDELDKIDAKVTKVRANMITGIGGVEAVARGGLEAAIKIGEAQFAAQERTSGEEDKGDQLIEIGNKQITLLSQIAENSNFELEPAGID